MKLKLHNLHEDRARLYTGSPAEVKTKLLADHPWARGDTLEDVLDALDASQGFAVEPLDALGKSESSPDYVGQLGLGAILDQAAAVTSWFSSVPDGDLRKGLADSWPDEVVLGHSAGTEEGLNSFRAISNLMKHEPTPADPPVSILPVTDSAQPVADALKRAFHRNRVQNINLGGKHSAGSMLARDPDSGRAWLLKPGSGGQSPAKGVSEEIASQARREAGFYHVAKLWGMGNDMPRAEVVALDHHDWAALDLLDWSWKNLNKVRQEQPQLIVETLEHLRRRGTLHRWAVLDWVLGNVDRHGANLMLGPTGAVKMIDHGSAFAGPSFDPGHDPSSFVPYYLRYRDPDWNTRSPEEKLASMPVLGEGLDRELRQWVLGLDAEAVRRVLEKDGLNPEPVLARLEQVKLLASGQNFSQSLDRLWAGV